MTYRRIRPVVRKEFRQIWRDKRSLAILLVFPSVLVMLIGYALNFDVKHVSVVVFDEDRSPESREFIRSFSNTEYFDFNYAAESSAGVDDLLNRGKALLAIIVPTDFSRNLLAGREST